MWILFCRKTTTIKSNGSEVVWNHTIKIHSLVLKGLDSEKSDSYKEKAKNKIFPHFQSSGTFKTYWEAIMKIYLIVESW